MANSSIRRDRVRKANAARKRFCGNCGWGYPTCEPGRAYCERACGDSGYHGECNWFHSYRGGCGAWTAMKYDKAHKRVDIGKFPTPSAHWIHRIRSKQDYRLERLRRGLSWI